MGLESKVRPRFGGAGFAPFGVSYSLRPTTPVATLRLQVDVVHPGDGTIGRLTLATAASHRRWDRDPVRHEHPGAAGPNHGSGRLEDHHVPCADPTGTEAFPGTINAYIGSLCESIPLHAVA